MKSDVNTGVVAIYSIPTVGSDDNTPLYQPFSQPERLQFHSAALFPSTEDALTKTFDITIPAQASSTKYAGEIVLFAHGQPAPPLVEGRIFDAISSGQHADFNGTMPVDVTATGHATWLALGSNSTAVALRYFGITPLLPRAAFSFRMEASVVSLRASGQVGEVNPALPLVKKDGDVVMLGRGAIDSRRRYVRQSADGDRVVALGPTLSVVGSGKSPGPSYIQNELGWRWRYSCGGYVRQTTVGWNGAATDGGTYDAPIMRVRR